MQSDTLKAITMFLEANKLTDTLSTLLAELEKQDGHRRNEKSKSSVQNIAKCRINYNNEAESSQIRDHFQKTDENVLRRLVSKLNSKLARSQSN